ncbi:MAG: TlyA family RNA methyltransferase [Clostridia bacterium]|nr:TlyA family RNA methyltransferase [Clostridia bacterium]
MAKVRLDKLLVDRSLAPTRTQAASLIMAGEVYVGEAKASKAGELVPEEADVSVRRGMEFVSRGGYKLKKALDVFDVDLSGAVCLDCGASTGGFTDCMLQRGAARVYAVDVGYGQLAYKLRTDERVVTLEKTNVRSLTREQVPENVDFASADLAFISLKLVLPVIFDFLKSGARAVCLIKPQFEAGREKVGKKGVVRDPAVHREVISDIVSAAGGFGFSVLGLDFSPIKGPEGNIEYLLLRGKDVPGTVIADSDAGVSGSHGELGQNKSNERSVQP